MHRWIIQAKRETRYMKNWDLQTKLKRTMFTRKKKENELTHKKKNHFH